MQIRGLVEGVRDQKISGFREKEDLRVSYFTQVRRSKDVQNSHQTERIEEKGISS
jgi:hypothetical protein